MLNETRRKQNRSPTAQVTLEMTIRRYHECLFENEAQLKISIGLEADHLKKALKYDTCHVLSGK